MNVPRVKNYTAFLDKNGLRGKRIGIVRMIGNYDTFKEMPNDTKNILQANWNYMRAHGALVIDNIGYLNSIIIEKKI